MITESFKQDMLPRFSEIHPDNVTVLIRDALASNKRKLAALISQPGPFNWDNLMQPLEEMSDELNKIWSAISHLHAVMETDALRMAYNDTQPLITAYHTELSQNETLYRAIASIKNSTEFDKLNPAQQKIIDNDIRDFKLAGIHLSADKKAQVAEWYQRLSLLTTKFSENVLDATHGWIKQVTDKDLIAGLPEQALQLAVDNARQRNLEGYVFTLDYPSYSTAMKFLHNRELRKTLYEAYTTRASDQGPNAGKWDNSAIMNNILYTRHELARLIGYDNYAQYSLVTKMAKTPEDVLGFLHDLLNRSKPIAEAEYQAVLTLAKEDGLSELEAWDMAYYSEKLRQTAFDYSQEDLRPYFPVETVLRGMFQLVQKLFGIRIKKDDAIETWHPQAQFFSIFDENETIRGGFYIDLYARPHKRDGAWMDECRVRRLNGKGIQYPVAYLTCNFMPPIDGQPALLTHDDVLTLFHEFGHCLHHMLTRVDYPSVAGINGVPWDAVEFPSQFMENFCWERESLHLISSHYQTGEPLPDVLYQKMIAAKHFQTGLQMVRQIEFSLFDFLIHLEYDPAKPAFIQSTLNAVRKEAAVVRAPLFNRFQHSFAHIFAGGYAAGYYSYKWAEVLSSDAYGLFEEKGIFDRETGRSFMKNILEIGGVRDPMDSFIAFRGRKPHVEALLRQSGMTETRF